MVPSTRRETDAMISAEMVGTVNKQINAEMYSAYLYLAMAAYFEGQSLPGFANWMECQAQEEMVHAMKFYGHVNERDGQVVLDAIEKPPGNYDSPLAVFEAAYAHEQKVTGLINGLAALAQKENDFASQVFLQWFISEQVEEEASAKAIVDELKMIAGHPHGLMMVDRELASRVFTPPAATIE